VVNFLMVSTVLLWICVIALVFVVLMLLRQVGVLYERVAPAGALMMNRQLKAGETAPEMSLSNLSGEKQIQVGGRRQDQRGQLLFFLDANCPVCKTLLPALKSAAKAERSWLDVVLAGDSEAAKQQALVEDYALHEFDFVNSELLGKNYGVSKLPYAVLINGEGVIQSMGIINSREHIESLFVAREQGVASIQEYMRAGAVQHANVATGEK